MSSSCGHRSVAVTSKRLSESESDSPRGTSSKHRRLGMEKDTSRLLNISAGHAEVLQDIQTSQRPKPSNIHCFLLGACEFCLLASADEKAGAGLAMHMSHLTAEKLIRVLQDLEGGSSVRSACQRQHISTQTFYRWRNRMMVKITKPLERLHVLETENRRLKRKIAELSLDYNALRAALINETRREC